MPTNYAELKKEIQARIDAKQGPVTPEGELTREKFRLVVEGIVRQGQHRKAVAADLADLVVVRTSVKENHLSIGEMAERGITLVASDKALDVIGSQGFDPVYGARPLKRAIQQLLENTLANRILAGEFVSGDTVHVDAEGAALVFSK